ncbi:hypothetical protein ACHAXN_007608 [Cyclotella atomus]
MYRDRWERNQRVKDSVRRAKSGSEKLRELNSVAVPQPDPRPNMAQQNAVLPSGLPEIPTQALTNVTYAVVAQVCVGKVPNDDICKRVRGKDHRKRRGRHDRSLCDAQSKKKRVDGGP